MRAASLHLASCLALLSCTSEKQEKWQSVTIDGKKARDFVLVTRGGEITGGHDACNGWGLSDHPDLIVMEAQECPPDPLRDVYWNLARGAGATYTREGPTLTVRRGKHVAIFQRA